MGQLHCISWINAMDWSLLWILNYFPKDLWRTWSIARLPVLWIEDGASRWIESCELREMISIHGIEVLSGLIRSVELELRLCRLDCSSPDNDSSPRHNDRQFDDHQGNSPAIYLLIFGLLSIWEYFRRTKWNPVEQDDYGTIKAPENDYLTSYQTI